MATAAAGATVEEVELGPVAMREAAREEMEEEEERFGDMANSISAESSSCSLALGVVVWAVGGKLGLGETLYRGRREIRCMRFGTNLSVAERERARLGD